MKNLKLVAVALVLALHGCGDGDDVGDVDDDDVDVDGPNESNQFVVEELVCSEEDPDHEITITGDAFMPGTLVIDDGDSVRWTNIDDRDHSVVSGNQDSAGAGDLFGSEVMVSGSEYCLLFDEPGTVRYFDGLHSGRSGSITIED